MCDYSKHYSYYRRILIFFIFYFATDFNFLLVSRHRTLMNYLDKDPVVDKDAFVAPGASVIGDVKVGRGSSIWYGCVLRGNQNCDHIFFINVFAN